MSVELNIPVKDEQINSYRELRNCLDDYDSLNVLSRLEHYTKKSNTIQDEPQIVISFENDNKMTNIACCENKCIIF